MWTRMKLLEGENKMKNSMINTMGENKIKFSFISNDNEKK